MKSSPLCSIFQNSEAPKRKKRGRQRQRERRKLVTIILRDAHKFPSSFRLIHLIKSFFFCHFFWQKSGGGCDVGKGDPSSIKAAKKRRHKVED